MLNTLLLHLAALAALTSASPVDQSLDANKRQTPTVTPYGPEQVDCPSGSLVRAANGLNPKEATWVAARKTKASASLKSWLAGTGANFPVLSNANMPGLGLVDGGGGIRGFLLSAGVHKALDGAESQKTQMSGLYQAMLYETGLSGSSASLASYASNNWPTTSDLQSQLWEASLESGLLTPGGSDASYAEISTDVAAKAAAGFVVTVVDAWARILSYLALQGDDAGVAKRYSDITSASGYTSHSKPFPIITTIGIDNLKEGCGLPAKNATQFEFTPIEFGSWEATVGNFMQTKYVGTSMNDGAPVSQGLSCVNGFDNAGWIVACSTNVFNQQCGYALGDAGNLIDAGDEFLSVYPTVRGIIKPLLGPGIQPLYGIMPNPFFGMSSAPEVSLLPNLMLVDGGETIQVPPIWPLLYRPVDVMFVSDNSADNPTNYKNTGANINYPNGRQLYHTWFQAGKEGVRHRLPTIPTPKVFQQKGLNKKTTFFGCTSPNTMTIVYLPNRPISYDTDIDAGVLQFSTAATRGIIENGVKVATDDGAAGFDVCVGCAIMKKAAAKAGKALPAACAGCFSKYCYN